MKELRQFILPLALLVFSSCAGARLEQQLDPDSREFFSKVRYLITREERSLFLRLPADERKGFIAEFWSKRDPTPDTEENEYRDEYYRRIEETNYLFREGGGAEPGWLQDRGRIFILLGRPDDRQTFPRGTSFYGVPTEIWYYGSFPIVFVDESWSGTYRLEPLSAIHLAEIMSVQMRLKPLVATQRGVLECRLDLDPVSSGRTVAHLAIPYKKIWFKSEGSVLKTTLTAAIDLLDEAGRILDHREQTFPLDLTEDSLREVIRGDYRAEIPLEIKPGTRWINLTLTNAADESRHYKKVKVSFSPEM